ncbi:DUF3995 domain-containing protein [Longispora albida]|uniref:DUF3995 domain-containing protein n=1 Tax=Longispora albida TaxID=203523 RepID=UPI0012FB0A68|nr:DUF3995 domain-containing protein [Longispora albida]
MKILGASAALIVLAAGLLHVIWMFSPWPVSTRERFARIVVGVEQDKLPSRPLTALVAVALGAAAFLIAARSGVLPAPGPFFLYAAGVPVVCGVFLLRGTGGLVMGLMGKGLPEYIHWDLRVYSPLCLFLTALTAPVMFA